MLKSVYIEKRFDHRVLSKQVLKISVLLNQQFLPETSSREERDTAPKTVFCTYVAHPILIRLLCFLMKHSKSFVEELSIFSRPADFTTS